MSMLFSTDLEAIVVAISLALCDFKSLRFEIAERIQFAIWASPVAATRLKKGQGGYSPLP